MKNSNHQPHKVIISGGGTGGHIFPAIAIANALKEKVQNIEIRFVGAQGRMEMEKVPAAGFPIEGLWISGFQRKLTIRNLLFPVKVLMSLQKAKRIITKFKPDVAVGVGGYASGPTLRAAIRQKIPALIQEQNSYPGITNKILSRSVQKICVAYEGMEKYFPSQKIVMTGNPVRRQVIMIEGKREEAAVYFKLDPLRKTVLVVGGSQGAMSINKSIHHHLGLFETLGTQLIWQTGKLYYQEAIEAVKTENVNLFSVHEFIDRMDLAYSMADIIVSRAGAIAISEICAVGKPPVFIPLPSAAEDHQTKNARALVEKNAAIMIHDRDAIENLGNVLKDLINDPQKQEMLGKNAASLAKPDAADAIADEIMKLITK
jgi:UDP-N-acetylglucosamine--N-acetylmuramyl-(pentapeptide) pyrophosphoryl-undecaprenol N-acetylglucosamine transferase